MKRVLIAFVVLLFAVSVYAESRLDLSGQYRMRGFSLENFGAWGGAPDFNDSTKADEENYFDQRFRVASTIKVADGITAHLRLDFAEETWGMTGTHSTDGDIDQDRAYVQIDKEMYNLKVGRQYFGLGNSMAFDMNSVGVNLTVKTPFAVTVGYIKESEGGMNSDDTNVAYEYDNGTPYTANTEDANVYFANLGYSNEMANMNLFYAYQDNGKGSGIDELNQTLIGLQADGQVGVVGFNAEYNYLTGENDTTNKDYVGSQFYGDVFGNVGMLKVGTEVVYAAGTDDPDETQISMLNASSNDYWDVFLPLGGFAGSDIMDFAFGYNGIFELDENAGSMGIAPYVSVSPMDKLTLSANVGYFEPQEDSVTNLNSATVAIARADYKLYENVGLKAQYGYISPDVDDGGNDDPAQGFYGKFYVNF